MKRIAIKPNVSDAANLVIASLKAKGFSIFADVDHRANAQSVDLELPACRTLIFGNPAAGTKLMQTDIAISLDLPLRLAIVESGDETHLIHQTTDYYVNTYAVQGHPVLEKMEGLFSKLAIELNA